MRAEPDRRAIERLGEVLRQEADQVQVAPDARARLDRRIAFHPEPRRRLRWPGPAVAVLALGLVLTVVLLFGSGGWHRSARPAPVASPTASTASGTPSGTPSLSGSDLPTTLVYYPRPDGRLVAEPRLRTTLAAAVGEVSGEPANEGVAWPFGSLKLDTVTEQDGTVVVDYSEDDHIVPGDPDVKTARFWTQSLVHTVAAYTGKQEPVLITLQGRSFRLFDLLDTRDPFGYQAVDEGRWAGVAAPTGVPTSSDAAVVGAVASGVDQVTWTVLDPRTRKTLASGSAPVREDRTYAFALAAAPGQYQLRIDAGRPGEDSSRSYGAWFTIT